MTDFSVNSDNKPLENGEVQPDKKLSQELISSSQSSTSPAPKYKKEYDEIAKKAVMLGMDFDEAAQKVFNIPASVLKQWMLENPSFAQAIKDGADLADMMVVESLHKIAVGYDKEEEVALPTGTVTIMRHHEPNINAIKYWLNNKQSEKWKNKIDQNLSGEVKGGVVFVAIDKDDEGL